KTYNVKRLEYLMIHYSDNAGYFMLSSVTGGRDGLNAMVKDLGCDEIIVGSPYWGRLTSREMGLVWREIYYYGQSGTAGGTRVYELFRKAKYNDLHSYMGYEVVHKSGWGNKSLNDAGIVYYKDRHFVAVVFVERVDARDEDSAKGQFKKVCKFLVKVMKEYKAYYDSGFTLPTEKEIVTTVAPVTAAPTQAPTQPVVTEAPTTKATEAPTTATTAVPTVATTAALTTKTEAPTVKTEAPTTEAAPPPSTSAPAAE
ncbi:MAG: serine hydrolase, partial [Clostridia bacterium]|nr:serine hydrolase [Clostridia bacterium]